MEDNLVEISRLNDKFAGWLRTKIKQKRILNVMKPKNVKEGEYSVVVCYDGRLGITNHVDTITFYSVDKTAYITFKGNEKL